MVVKHLLPITFWSLSLAGAFVFVAFLFVRPGTFLRFLPYPQIARRVFEVPVTAFLAPAYVLERLGIWNRESETAITWLRVFVVSSVFWGTIAHFLIIALMA